MIEFTTRVQIRHVFRARGPYKKRLGVRREMNWRGIAVAGGCEIQWGSPGGGRWGMQQGGGASGEGNDNWMTCRGHISMHIYMYVYHMCESPYFKLVIILCLLNDACDKSIIVKFLLIDPIMLAVCFDLSFEMDV